MKKELLWVVDKNGQPTGASIERKLAHELGIPHLAVALSIIKLNKGLKPQILISQRSKTNEKYAELWDTALSGHIKFGATADETVREETAEELGITLPNIQKGKFEHVGKFKSFLEVSSTFHENMFFDHYILYENIALKDITLQPEEVQAVKYATIQEIEVLIAANKMHPRLNWLQLVKESIANIKLQKKSENINIL